MRGFLIYTTINFMETAYVHTLKTNANMMTTDFTGIIPRLGLGYWDYLGLEDEGLGNLLVSTNKTQNQIT